MNEGIKEERMTFAEYLEDFKKDITSERILHDQISKISLCTYKTRMGDWIQVECRDTYGKTIEIIIFSIAEMQGYLGNEE